MSKLIRLTRGLDIKMTGEAQKELSPLTRPAVFEIVPDHFAGITPKLDVHVDDHVKAGQSLFHDKLFADMCFASPVSGKIIAINRGERRKVMSISIEADAQTEYEKYDLKLDALSASEVKSAILKAGLWFLIKQRPYDCIANPQKEAKAVFVSAFDSAPLAPDYQFILQHEQAALQAGVSALAKMVGSPVQLGVRHGGWIPQLKDVTITEFAGPHPAGNVGIQINHVCPVNKGEMVLTVNIQDVAVLGRLFTKGVVDMHKAVAVTGPMVIEPHYLSVLPGMSVKDVFKCNIQRGLPIRYIAGNVLSGHQVSLDEFVSPYDNQFTAIDEGSETHEFMGWIAPRFKTFSQNRTVPSFFLKCLMKAEDYKYDARMLGGRRAIIVSGEYDKVLPMDIYPEYLIKAMIAGNIDKMEQLGAYEVAPEDFALPEFVCTSKMPLQAIVRQALDNMKSELE